MSRFEELNLAGARRTTWIFGAGASAPNPYGVPSQAELLRAFFRKGFPGGQRRQQYVADLKADVKDYCKYVLPGGEVESETVSLEEVFSAYELMLSEPRTKASDRRFAEQALRRLKEAIQLATYVHGRGDSRKWKPHDRGHVRSPYSELLEKLFPTSASARAAHHAFITFNYDINLDRCLLNLRDTAGVDLDYGIDLANNRARHAPDFANPNSGTIALLLRTHGALNWFRCDACQSVFTTLNKHASVNDVSECWACGSENWDTVLVHPSFIRKYEDPVIQLIWGRCQEELVQSDRWVFVGYSLPAADVHFRELLRHCMRTRAEYGLTTEVRVVGRKNSDGCIIEPKVEENYTALFGSKVRFWNSTRNGFLDFPQSIT